MIDAIQEVMENYAGLQEENRKLRAEVEKLNKEIQALQMDPRYDQQRNEGANEAAEMIAEVLRNGKKPVLSWSPLADSVDKVAKLRERMARLEEALRPFAEMIEAIDRYFPNSLSAKDYRHAAEVLKEVHHEASP